MLRAFPVKGGQLGQALLHLAQPVIDTLNPVSHPPEIFS